MSLLWFSVFDTKRTILTLYMPPLSNSIRYDLFSAVTKSPNEKDRKMTPYQKHCKKWKKCVRCALCNSRNKVVLARGKIPAEILFIGEAPGTSEDVLGRPFVGPAGKLLDKIMEQSIDSRHDYALTNIVACIPLNSEGNKTTEPHKNCILACRVRLKEFILLVEPQLIVLVGNLAAKFAVMAFTEDVKTIQIIHPAAILRMDLSQKGLAVKRSIVTLEDAIEEMI